MNRPILKHISSRSMETPAENKYHGHITKYHKAADGRKHVPRKVTKYKHGRMHGSCKKYSSLGFPVSSVKYHKGRVISKKKKLMQTIDQIENHTQFKKQREVLVRQYNDLLKPLPSPFNRPTLGNLFAPRAESSAPSTNEAAFASGLSNFDPVLSSGFTWSEPTGTRRRDVRCRRRIIADEAAINAVLAAAEKATAEAAKMPI